MATIETADAIALTERAADKVRDLMAQEPAGEAEVLRVAIQGGGCGGFEYALGFDRGATEDDAEYEFYGVKVVVDPASAQYLKGATVDFVESLQESGLQDRQPERLGLVRLRAQLPGRGRERPESLARLRPLALRVAVVGSGPAGFYTAAPLLARRRRRST